jgi:hypothetical protein
MYELGMGLAIEGRAAEAKSIATCLIAPPTLEQPVWLAQASALCAADIFALSGSASRASRVARRGIAVGGKRLLNRNYGGPFARWVAQAASEDADPARGLRELADAFPNLEGLHAKDSTEVQASRLYLQRLVGDVEETDLKAFTERLTSLPPGLSAALTGLGLLPGR